MTRLQNADTKFFANSDNEQSVISQECESQGVAGQALDSSVVLRSHDVVRDAASGGGKIWKSPRSMERYTALSCDGKLEDEDDLATP